MQDYSHWLTKERAAQMLSRSTKYVEQLAKEKKIQHAKWKRPETGAHVSVYHPDDVARVRRELHPDAEPFVLPPVAEDSQNSQIEAPMQDSENSQTTRLIPPALFWEALIARLAQPQLPAAPPEPVEPLADLRHKVQVTHKEALRLGFSGAMLRKATREGKLENLTGDRYRMRDLEAI